MFLIFDTETTGLPKRWDAPLTDSDNWPRCIQIAWQVHDSNGQCLSHEDFLIKPDGFKIPYDSEKIHGISTELADKDGVSLEEVIIKFKSVLKDCKFICGHNVKFDLNILGAEFYRVESNNPIEGLPVIDTCTEETASFCLLPGGRGGRYKLPTLSELHQSLFNSEFQEAHNATADVEATSRCLFELFRLKIINPEALRNYEDIKIGLSESLTSQVEPLGIKHRDLKKASSKLIKNQSKENVESVSFDLKKSNLNDVPFIHLHTHSQFSVLQSTSRLSELIKSASEDKMLAVALTDHSNLMGAFNFIKEVNNHNSSIDGSQIPIKPIIGCEFFVCEDHQDKSRRDDGFQIVFLAKNKRGYKNLSIMSSIAYTEGFYYVPRIDKEVIKKHKTDLIVLTGNLYGEIPSKILNISEEQAEESLLWWKEEFGTDLYVEVMRHGQENENRANEILIELSKKHKIKLVATNNSYYTNKREANAHDILLCVKDGEKQSTPIGKGRGYRFGLPNQEYYFKSQNEMKELFSNLPEAIINLKEIYEKVESYDLNREVLLPKFDIPIDFKSEGDSEDNKGENAYLRHLTNIGAEKRYGKISNDIKERLDFELEVIANTGYPGYFLIVQDLIKAARNLGVSVGPGRGSAAGSVVAYCLGITSLDPIKYNLLFERFLNPDRVSMPDIDIDFDDEGRGRVLDYVIKKYGTDQVAQIITYGTMAAKSSIRDTGRVLDLSLGETDRIAKLVPNMKLNSIFQMKNDEMKQSLRGEEYSNVKQLKEVYSLNNLAGETLKQAEILEGSLRNTGTHACGVIITPDDIREFVPITVAKDSDLYVTQYDNSVVEQAGLLKIDFLGLKTLTLIKETVKLIKYNHKIDLDPDKFPLDDQKTFNLFQKGETVGIFQYESLGMRRYLKDLKPNVFDDLIAMNALYRPGPLEYIPSFISRKNGNEEIRYDLPEMEEFLKETYGITVYQEQVMLLSQKLAGFSKGDADLLRKAMGKKIFDLLEKLKPKFIEGGVNNNHAPEILGKIWKDWEAFASYAFNKSHSTCYAWIGYQTAYLKAHYPAEYMAAVLSNNMNDIKQVSFFMEECRRMGIKVLGPDVNESFYKFAVNESGAIRFGMGAIKGVGKTAVETIIENRKDKKYESIFDLVKKVDLRLANKKTFENLAYAGGFDSFQNSHRAQYFHIDNEGIPFIERVLRFGSKYQENMKSSQMNLFGEKSDNVYQVLKLPECEEFGSLERLKNEKEVVGIYISAHPLDDFKKEIELFKTLELNFLKDLKPLLRKTFFVAGIINSVEHLEAKNGNLWGKFVIEDFKDQYEFKIFGEEYLKFRHFLIVDQFIRFKILVREGWTNRETGKVGEPRIQFVKFEMLQNTIRDNSEKITLTIDINKINNDLIEQLKKDLKPFKGDKALFFNVMDHKKSIRLSLESQKGGVDISTEFLTHLDKNNWDYRLN